jgi:hypothetical protein
VYRRRREKDERGRDNIYALSSLKNIHLAIVFI